MTAAHGHGGRLASLSHLFRTERFGIVCPRIVQTVRKEKTLGEIIAEARKAKPWSLRQLGEALGKLRPGSKAVSPQFLNDLEQNRRTPSDDMIALLAKVLDLDTDVLRAAAGATPTEVVDYLKTNPEAGTESVARLFRRAREVGFQDWDQVLQVIEKHRPKKR